MLTVQYTGKGERTIGTQVVYPGELLMARPNQLAAWQAEHGDVFVVVRGGTQSDTPAATETETEPATTEPATTEPATTEPAQPEPKAKRK